MGLFNFIGRVLGIGEKVVDKVVTDKDAKEQFKHEFKMALEQNEQKLEELAYKDIASARDLAKTEYEQLDGKFIDTLRALPRPILALLAGGLWAYSIFQRVDPTLPHLELNYWDYGIISAVITFYFGARGLDKRLKKKI